MDNEWESEPIESLSFAPSALAACADAWETKHGIDVLCARWSVIRALWTLYAEKLSADDTPSDEQFMAEYVSPVFGNAVSLREVKFVLDPYEPFSRFLEDEEGVRYRRPTLSERERFDTDVFSNVVFSEKNYCRSLHELEELCRKDARLPADSDDIGFPDEPEPEHLQAQPVTEESTTESPVVEGPVEDDDFITQIANGEVVPNAGLAVAVPSAEEGVDKPSAENAPAEDADLGETQAESVPTEETLALEEGASETAAVQTSEEEAIAEETAAEETATEEAPAEEPGVEESAATPAAVPPAAPALSADTSFGESVDAVLDAFEAEDEPSGTDSAETPASVEELHAFYNSPEDKWPEKAEGHGGEQPAAVRPGAVAATSAAAETKFGAGPASRTALGQGEPRQFADTTSFDGEK